MITLPVAALNTAEVYKLLIGSIIPRPIALVSTVSAAGQHNLAPFSSYNLVASNPASLVFSISASSSGGKKDTLINLENSSEFVVNSAQAAYAEQIAQAGFEYDYGDDEAEKVGFTRVPSTVVAPARIAQSLVQMECRVLQLVPIGLGQAGSSTLVIGEILVFHIAESIYNGGRIDAAVFDPLARLGGYSYCRLGSTSEHKPK